MVVFTVCKNSSCCRAWRGSTHFCVAEDLHSTLFSSEDGIPDHCQDCKDSSDPWSDHQFRKGWSLNAAVAFMPKLPGGDWESSRTCGSALGLVTALLRAGGSVTPLGLCFVAAHGGHSEVQAGCRNRRSNYSSIRPQRGVEGWHLGFVCFHHVKLEVKRCNAPSQEISSLLGTFIAVKISLFRTSQKYWCALDECVLIHISKNAYILNDLLQAARKCQGRVFIHLYKLHIIYM